MTCPASFCYPSSMNDVKTFIEQLPRSWQKQKCHELLAIVQESGENIESSIKWKNPYFTYKGKALLKWYCANDWINVYFFRGSELEDPAGTFIETDNKRMRTIKIFPDTTIDHEACLTLIKQALDSER